MIIKNIDAVGQRFFDEPVYAHPKSLSLIAHHVSTLFKYARPKPIVLGYERVKLRWMKPDGKGGLVPR